MTKCKGRYEHTWQVVMTMTKAGDYPSAVYCVRCQLRFAVAAPAVIE